MHEVGLMMQTLERAAELARERGASAIHRMVLCVGAHSGVDAGALRLAFEAVTPGTMATAATLEIVETRPRCDCPGCGTIFEPDGAIYACPRCGHLARELSAGHELELTTLEIS